MARRPLQIRNVLLVTNLVVLALPLLGLFGMRFYETELIRRTETELYAQGAFITAAYRAAVRAELQVAYPGTPVETALDGFGRRAADEWLVEEFPDDELRPIPATLTRRRDRVAPPAPPPGAPGRVDPVSRAAGLYVTPILLEGKNITLAGIRVVDFNGNEVANTRGDREGVSLLSWDEVPRALQGEVVSQLRERRSDEPPPSLTSRSRGTRVRVFVAMPILAGDRVLGAVVLSRTPISLSQALYNNRWPFAAAAGALLVVVLALSWFTSRTIARPISALVGEADRIRRGETPTALARPGTAEADRLSAALVRMAGELRDREEYIRTFAKSVSHEFKTPLTSMRGSIELLQDHWDSMSEEERGRFLDLIESERNRLERLVSRLLDLARADVVRPGDDHCDAVTVASEVVSHHADLGKQIALSADREHCPVAMDAAVLDTVVSALVTNAIQHGGPDVRIEITGDDPVCISVSDDGAGISDANAARVFEEFFTTDRAGGGTGVGLAIVKTLCESHGGSVRLERDGGRTRFAVQLPGAEP